MACGGSGHKAREEGGGFPLQPPGAARETRAMARSLTQGTAPAVNGFFERAHLCDRCGSVMIEHHCKIRCPNCGYVRDCSDPRSPAVARCALDAGEVRTP